MNEIKITGLVVREDSKVFIELLTTHHIYLQVLLGFYYRLHGFSESRIFLGTGLYKAKRFLLCSPSLSVKIGMVFIEIISYRNIIPIKVMFIMVVCGSLVRENRAAFFIEHKNTIYMSYKEQMKDWLSKHPDATTEEAYEAGYMQSNVNWCHGKMECLTKLKELINKIIE